jgi:arylsulfatase A-like enzyme
VCTALLLVFGTGIACSPGEEGAPASSASEDGKRPNVLLILVDDLRPELGVYGAQHMVTPNIDQLAAEGLLFRQAYVHQAVCSPSRISLLTGLRPDSTDAHHYATRLRDVLPDAVTLPGHFKANGYTTVGVRGKIFHHAEDGAGAWSQGPIQAQGEGFGRGYLTEAAIAQSKSHGQGPSFEAAAVPDTAYEDGKVAARAVEQLARLANEEDPFFLAVGFEKPHLPFSAPQKYWDLYPREQTHLPANYFPPDGAPQWALTNYGELRNYADIPESGPVPRETAISLIRGYRASVSYVDAQVGRVLDALEQNGLRENTIVALWGDHGFKVGEHRSWSKHTNFEIDTQIPLIVRVPGMEAAGAQTEALVETVDVYPTLAELTGLPAPPQHQGLSFAPLIDDPNRPWKTAVFGQYRRGGSDGVLGRTVRTDRYRYVEWIDLGSEAVRARELYDHQTDPWENINMAGRAAYDALTDSLAAVLQGGWQEALPPASSGGL